MRVPIVETELRGRAELSQTREVEGSDELAAADPNALALQSPIRLMAENARKLYFLAAEGIDYIESCGDYVIIHIGDQKYIRRDTLKQLAEALQNQGFERIRRSVLINISKVLYAEKLVHGALAFTLRSGTRLVSRNRVKLKCAHTGRLGHN